MDGDATFERLIDIGLAMSAEKDINSLLERILREAKSMVNADAGSLYLTTENNTLAFAIVLNDSLSIYQGGNSGEPITLPEVPLAMPDGSPNLQNIASRAAISGTTINVEDAYKATADLDFSGPKSFDKITGYRSGSFLTVPLKSYHDECIGVLQLLNATDAAGRMVAFDQAAQTLVEALSSQASVALDHRNLVDRQEAMKRKLENEVDERTQELQSALSELSEAHDILKELTTIDAVTGVRNRQFFEDAFKQEWKRAIRQDYEISVLMLDIDHFKMVNDTHGHLAGDDCLGQVAKAIDEMLNRPSDLVARYGGEEFVVIMPYVAKQNAAVVAEAIRERIEEMSMRGDAKGIKVTISIGVATLKPHKGAERKQLIADADVALYRAKQNGRNQVMS